MHIIRYLLTLSLALVVSSCDTLGSAQNSGPNLPVRDSAPDGPTPQIAGGTNLPNDNHGVALMPLYIRLTPALHTWPLILRRDQKPRAALRPI